MMFSSRMRFILAVGLFSRPFSRRLADFRGTMPGATVLPLAAFAQFCSTRELDILGQRFETLPRSEPQA